MTGTPGGSRPHSSCPKRCQGRIRRQGEHSCRPPPTAGFHQGDQRLEIGWRRAWGSDGGRGTSQPALPPITQQSATGGKSSFQSGGCSGDCRLIWSVGRGLLAGAHQTSQPEWRTPTSVDPPGIAGPEKTLLLGQVPVGAPPGRGGARAMQRGARATQPFNARRLPSEGMAASETSGWSSSLAIELVGHPLVGHSRPVYDRSRVGRRSDDVAGLVDGGEQDIGGGSQAGVAGVQGSPAGEAVGQRQHLGDGQQ